MIPTVAMVALLALAQARADRPDDPAAREVLRGGGPTRSTTQVQPAPARSAAGEPGDQSAAEDDGGQVRPGDPAEPAPPLPEDPARERETQPASEEITVYGDRQVQQRRAELDRALQRLDYRRIDREGVTVYRPDSVWEPSVWVYDGGFVVVRRSPVRFEPPVAGRSPLRYLWCIPPFTPMCVRLGGQLISERKLQQARGRLATDLDPFVDRWQQALIDEGMKRRIGEEIPAQLTAAWAEGVPLEPGGPVLSSPADRRRAILAFWATRADTPEGDLARAVTAEFIALEIQTSADPATAEEIAEAEARCRCGPLLPDPPAGGSPPR